MYTFRGEVVMKHCNDIFYDFDITSRTKTNTMSWYADYRFWPIICVKNDPKLTLKCAVCTDRSCLGDVTKGESDEVSSV